MAQVEIRYLFNQLFCIGGSFSHILHRLQGCSQDLSQPCRGICAQLDGVLQDGAQLRDDVPCKHQGW